MRKAKGVKKRVTIVKLSSLLKEFDKRSQEETVTMKEESAVGDVKTYRLFYKGEPLDFIGTKEVCEEHIRRDKERVKNYNQNLLYVKQKK